MSVFSKGFFVIFVLLIYGLKVNALEFPEPVNWEDLQVIQQNSLLSLSELGLSTKCPDEVSGEPGSKMFQNILYTNYLWEEYETKYGKCLVLIMPTLPLPPGSERQKDFLEPNEAQVLLSASKQVGFEDKGFFEQADQINISNANELDSMLNRDCVGFQDIPDNGMQLNPNLSYPEQSENNNQASISQGNAHVGDDHVVVFDNINVMSGCSAEEDLGNNEVDQSLNGSVPDGGRVTNVGEYPNYLNTLMRMSYESSNTTAGSAVIINPFVAFTAAHNIFELSPRQGASHITFLPACNGPSGCPFGNIIVSQGLVSNAFFSLPLSSAGSFESLNVDYAAIQLALPVALPAYLPLNIDYLPILSEIVTISGYPSAYAGNPTVFSALYNDFGEREQILPLAPSLTAYSSIDLGRGASGGPATHSTGPFPFDQFLYGHLVGDYYNPFAMRREHLVRPYTSAILGTLSIWASWSPNSFLNWLDAPQSFQTYNILSIPPFAVELIPFNNRSGAGAAEDNIAWTSSLNGDFGIGENIDTQVLQQSLTNGFHMITASIDDGVFLASRSVAIEITGPEGEINAPDFCVVDLQFPMGNTCDILISWSTTDVPLGLTPIIFNNLTNETVASGRNGSVNIQVSTAANNISLHESDDKVLTLDEVTVDAKVPTGNLSSNLGVCSLEPSPFAPDGSPRDPKATPPGCDVVLSWNNVTYAQNNGPFIYFRSVGSNDWFRLTELGCSLSGDSCSGSLNTRDISPELVHAGGVEFYLLQFDRHDSGVLSGPVTVSGRRFADVYEFDNTFQYANLVSIGTVQNGHSFHKPAVYDPSVDIDTYAITLSGIPASTRLKAETVNIANGLVTNLGVTCVGDLFITPPNGAVETIYGNHPLGSAAAVSLQNGVEPGSKVITWTAQRVFNLPPQNGTSFRLLCDQHLVTASRVSGAAGEDLTYSIRFLEDVQAGSGPDVFELDNEFSTAAIHEVGGDPNSTNVGIFEHNFSDNPVDWFIPSCTHICTGPTEVYVWSVEIDTAESGVNVCPEIINADNNEPVRLEICNGSSVGENTNYNIAIQCTCIGLD